MMLDTEENEKEGIIDELEQEYHTWSALCAHMEGRNHKIAC
jgi:hypothetical protein